nr:uncharacterized protein K02A2.6-like [Onthophagus taurus]
MKMLARSLYWWPGIDKNIEDVAAHCVDCATVTSKQPEQKFTTWTKSKKAWQRLHIDFFQKFGKYFLIVVDALSRWVEVKIVSSTNTITPLRGLFTVFRPPFNGEKFRKFCIKNKIKHILTPPLHPRSNGCAERQVATIKQNMEKIIKCKTDEELQFRIDNILLKHHVTPNSVTGKTPAKYLLKYIPRTKLDFLKPREKRENVKLDHIKRPKKTFFEGEEVLVYNKRNGKNKWIKGKVPKAVSRYTYLVNTEGEIRYIHGEDLKTYKIDQPEILPDLLNSTRNVIPQTSQTDTPDLELREELHPSEDSDAPEPEACAGPSPVITPHTPKPFPPAPPVRKSMRIKRPPNRQNL